MVPEYSPPEGIRMNLRDFWLGREGSEVNLPIEADRVLVDWLVLFLLVMVGSILGLWAIQPLDPGPPGSVRGGLPLMAWVSSWTSHWLAILSISALFLSLHNIL